MPSDETRHADETTQHWRDMPEQCDEDAWQLFVSLMHHFIRRPEAWAKLYALGNPVSEGEKSVYAPEVKQAFLRTLNMT